MTVTYQNLVDEVKAHTGSITKEFKQKIIKEYADLSLLEKHNIMADAKVAAEAKSKAIKHDTKGNLEYNLNFDPEIFVFQAAAAAEVQAFDKRKGGELSDEDKKFADHLQAFEDFTKWRDHKHPDGKLGPVTNKIIIATDCLSCLVDLVAENDKHKSVASQPDAPQKEVPHKEMKTEKLAENIKQNVPIAHPSAGKIETDKVSAKLTADSPKAQSTPNSPGVTVTVPLENGITAEKGTNEKGPYVNLKYPDGIHVILYKSDIEGDLNRTAEVNRTAEAFDAKGNQTHLFVQWNDDLVRAKANDVDGTYLSTEFTKKFREAFDAAFKDDFSKLPALKLNTLPPPVVNGITKTVSLENGITAEKGNDNNSVYIDLKYPDGAVIRIDRSDIDGTISRSATFHTNKNHIQQILQWDGDRAYTLVQGKADASFDPAFTTQFIEAVDAALLHDDFSKLPALKLNALLDPAAQPATPDKKPETPKPKQSEHELARIHPQQAANLDAPVASVQKISSKLPLAPITQPAVIEQPKPAAPTNSEVAKTKNLPTENFIRPAAFITQSEPAPSADQPIVSWTPLNIGVERVLTYSDGHELRVNSTPETKNKSILFTAADQTTTKWINIHANGLATVSINGAPAVAQDAVFSTVISSAIDVALKGNKELKGRDVQKGDYSKISALDIADPNFGIPTSTLVKTFNKNLDKLTTLEAAGQLDDKTQGQFKMILSDMQAEIASLKKSAAADADLKDVLKKAADHGLFYSEQTGTFAEAAPAAQQIKDHRKPDVGQDKTAR